MEAIGGEASKQREALPTNDKWKIEYWKFAYTSSFPQSVRHL